MFAQAIARTVQTYAGRPAIVGEPDAISWREFGDRIARIAGGLKSIGCRPGDRIAVLAGNTSEHLSFIYAVSWAGCVLVPLNTRLSTDELNRIVDQSGSMAFASDEKNCIIAGSILEASKITLKSIAMDEGAVGEIILDDLAKAGGIDAWAAEWSDLAALYYTGGTTGHPKGVMVSDGAFVFQSLNMGADLILNSNTIFLHAPPMFHIAGAGSGHAVAFAGGAQAFLPEIVPEEFVKTVADIKATFLCLVPTMLTEMMEIENIADLFSSVRTISYGTAPISEALLRKVIERCPNVELVQFYGQSECVGPCTVLAADRHVEAGPLSGKLATAGIATTGNEIRIADETGNTVPYGTEGEILLRAPTVMLGYWQQPNLTADALKDGWLHTGDAGIMDDEGFVRVVDRLKDMIVTGGENVFCGEVENVISDHPEVKYCAVIGLPDDKWGERVHAVVGIEEGSSLDLEDLRNHCKEKVAGYKCPKSASFTTEPLPLSAVGKVRKDLLRAKYSTDG